MDWSCQLQAPAASPAVKEFPVPVGQQALWVSDLGWVTFRTEVSPAPTGNPKIISRIYSQYRSHYNAQSRQCLSRLCSTHTRHGQIGCHNTDYVLINGHDRTITVILVKHCTELHDDGSLVIRTRWSNYYKNFKYFIIILIVSTSYIFVHLLDNEVF